MKDNLGELRVDREAKPVGILTPPIKVSSLVLAGLCIGTALWGTLAQIPVRVNGLAVLISSEGVFQVTSPGAGRVIYPLIQDSDGDFRLVSLDWSRHAYEILFTAEEHSVKRVRELAEDIVNTNTDKVFPRFSKTSVSGGAGSGGSDTIQVKRGQLIAIVDNPSLRAEIAANLSAIAVQEQTSKQLRQLLNETLRESSNYSLSKTAQLRRMKSVYEQGALSETDFLNGQADVQRSRQNISDIKSRIASLDKDISLQQQQLYRALSMFISRCFVFAKDNAEISQVLLNQNAEVVPGQILMTLNWAKEVAPDEIPVFLNQQAASQIAPGMKSISTPLGFSSSEIGGIVGQVTMLDPYPISPAEIANRLGSQGLAQLVAQSGGLFQADIRLTRDEIQRLNRLRSAYRDEAVIQGSANNNNRAGYLWNNKSRPPISPREGFLLATQITTRYRTPLQMLLPAIHEVLGISAPDKLMKQNLNQPSS